nr:hypothetical protein Iba_chr14dCG0230 [Ipomoea batatas]
MFPAFWAKSIRNFSSITEAETDRSRLLLLLLLSLHSLIHRLPWLASHRCGRRNASKCRNLPFGFLDITHRSVYYMSDLSVKNVEQQAGDDDD